ncbi:MAG: MFS transporter [Chloroflexi bacterium]|nr:MFS transporter [Chloroflexota bacterium]
MFYGWWIVGTASLMLTLMSLTVFQGIGTYFVALERQFGWSRTTLSGAFAFSRVQGAAIGPLEGFLIDRLGNRRMFMIGYSLMGIGFILLSQIQNIWQFYVTFVIITLGSSLGGWLTMISMVNNWFSRRRTFAMATAMSGIHFGGFLVPVLALSIEFQGFRATMFGIGVLILAIIIPISRVIRNRPEDYGMLPDGDPPRPAKRDAVASNTAPEIDDEPDFTASQALRTPAFWIVTFTHMSSTLSIVALSVHLVPKLTDMGLSLSSAGVVVLSYTAIALPLQFVSGYFADKMPKPPAIFFFLMVQAAALVVIAFADNLYMAYVFAVLWGIAFGGRGPLLTSIRGDYFGRKAFATISGLSQFPSSLAMIATPLFAGYMFDTRGSYFIPFTTFAIIVFFGAFLILFARKPKLASASRSAAPE